MVQVTGGCTVYLAGRLAEAQVCELRRVCAEATGRLRLDLTDLVSLDAVGVDVLRRLRDDGAAIVGVAEYLKQKLGPSGRHLTITTRTADEDVRRKGALRC